MSRFCTVTGAPGPKQSYCKNYTVQYSMVWYGMVQSSRVWYNVLQYSIAQYIAWESAAAAPSAGRAGAAPHSPFRSTMKQSLNPMAFGV